MLKKRTNKCLSWACTDKMYSKVENSILFKKRVYTKSGVYE